MTNNTTNINNTNTIIPKGIIPKEIIPKGIIPKGQRIVIPNAENLPQEEIDRLRHNERMRRYRERTLNRQVEAVKTKQEIRKIDTSELIDLSKDTRNLAIQTLNKKLVELYNDEEGLNKVNLATLATVFGILFDKSQLLNGLATENIAIQAKIDINMNSDTALTELNKMREKYQEQST